VETVAGVSAVSASVTSVGPRFFSVLGVALRMGREFVETGLLDSEPTRPVIDMRHVTRYIPG
jgi:hypothetical protein